MGQCAYLLKEFAAPPGEAFDVLIDRLWPAHGASLARLPSGAAGLQTEALVTAVSPSSLSGRPRDSRLDMSSFTTPYGERASRTAGVRPRRSASVNAVDHSQPPAAPGIRDP